MKATRGIVMTLLTVSKHVDIPVARASSANMQKFRNILRDCGYNMENCARKLDVFPRIGINFWPEMRPNWKFNPDDIVDNLIKVFIDGDSVSKNLFIDRLSGEFVDIAIEIGVLREDNGMIHSEICLFPCYGKYIATDKAAKNTAINQVMWLWGESYLLGGLVKRVPRRRAVDLGTGSGIHAILAADHCQQVVGGDVNPRALAFANFNAALNGLENVSFMQSDLLEAFDGTFDLLTANPPYAPDYSASAGDNFWSGGPNGTELLSRIVRYLPERLDDDGVAHIVALYPNPPGTTIKHQFDVWLDGNVRDWEVLDHTWRVPQYQDLFSVQPYEGDKSAWRFGVVSLRRRRGAEGWWKEAAGRGVFFGPDGSCRVTADHEAS